MELNSVDFNKLAVFCQIIESGNYQRASEALGVTPSALSQTVTGLEAAIGFRLFDRIGRRLVPTDRGLKVHREFRLSQGGFLRALRAMTGAETQIKGMLRIGAYLEFAKSRLSGVMKDFIHEFPDTQIKMVFDTPTRLQEMVLRGHLDMCFSIFPAQGSKRVASQAVSEEELVLIAARGMLPDSPAFSQTMAVPIIEYYFNHQPMQKWLYLHYQKRPKKIPIRIFASTAEMVLSLVREGAGIGIVPAYLVEGVKSVQVVRPTNKRFTDYIWLLQKSVHDQSALHKAFVRRFQERFALERKGS